MPTTSGSRSPRLRRCWDFLPPIRPTARACELWRRRERAAARERSRLDLKAARGRYGNAQGGRHGGLVRDREDHPRPAFFRRRDERDPGGAHGHHLADAERQSAQADHGGAELPRRRDRGRRHAGDPGNPDPRPRHGHRHRCADRPHLVLVDLLPRRATRRLEETSGMRFTRANGLVVHYLIEGPEGLPPLAFINPLGCDLRVWTDVAGILNPDFRVLCYDKRGHGLSESGPDQVEMVDYARDLAALLEVLGVGRAAIVGMSIGGVIAQELYRQRPDLVAALVLCDTAAKIGTDESWDERIAAIERGGIESIADAVLERWFTAGFRDRRAAEYAGVRAMLTRTPKQGYLAACGALKRADLRA